LNEASPVPQADSIGELFQKFLDRATKPSERDLQWRPYFLKFCEQHGDPVTVGPRLLYPDGFQYSSDSYSGPEWQPPDDPEELQRLVLMYWQVRRGGLQERLTQLRRIIEGKRSPSINRERWEQMKADAETELPVLIEAIAESELKLNEFLDP
jgi:hypothetical protein